MWKKIKAFSTVIEV